MTVSIAKGGVVLDGTALHEVVRVLAQDAALTKGAAVADLTDNSGGTSGSGVVAAVGTVTAFTVTGTDLTPKAGFDAELAKVKNALRTVQAKLEGVATATGVTLGYTYSGGGTNGAGTIAAISDALTEVTGDSSGGLAFAGTNDLVTTYKNAIATLIAGANKVRTAAGLSAIVDNSGGLFQPTVAVLAAASGAGVDGTSLSGVEGTDGEAILTKLRNAVATLAEGITDVTGNNAYPRVIAV